MGLTDDDKLVRAAAGRLYGAGQDIWDPNDRWNSLKRARIDSFARQYLSTKLTKANLILDLGSGSQPYEWLPKQTVSFDRFWNQIKRAESPVVGDVERLPFKNEAADLVICVASVLNYVSAAETIAEFARVMQRGAWIFLHFETSTSFEHLGTSRWGAPVARLETMNGGRRDTLWIYNPAYVIKTLQANALKIIQTHRFHILSALGLRIGLTQQQAAPMAALDGFSLPIANFSDDIILIAEKM